MANVEWLTVKEAALRAKYSVHYIRSAIRRKELVAHDGGTGGRPVYRITVADLDAFMMRERPSRRKKDRVLYSRHRSS